MKNSDLRKLLISEHATVRFAVRFFIYAAARVLPKSYRKKLMLFLDRIMPKKDYYCEKVSDSFYRGSEVGPKEIQSLAKQGIKQIINLKVQNPKEIKKIKKICEKQGISYLNVPINVFEKPNVEELKAIVQSATLDNPIYVHCKYGEDRTGFVTGIHLLLKENWPVEEILLDMEQKGYKKSLFPQFADTLEDMAASKI